MLDTFTALFRKELGEVERRWWPALWVLALVAVGLAATGPWVTLAATLLARSSGIVYSVGPRLKRYPVVGTLTNATNFTPLLWVGLPASGATDGTMILTQAFLLLLLQNQLLHEAADRDDDLRGGHRSIASDGGRIDTSSTCFIFPITPDDMGSPAGYSFGVSPASMGPCTGP